MRSFKRLAALCLALAAFFWLSGCATMAPKYSRPASPVPDAWPSGPSYKESAGKTPEKAVADIPWKEFFLDPHLREADRPGPGQQPRPARCRP